MSSRSFESDRLKSELNPRRYFWVFVGFYLFSVNFRSGNGDDVVTIRTQEQSSSPQADHGSHGIQIFKVDWPNVESFFVITLWILCASLAKIGFHMAPRLGRMFPESCLLIIVGTLIGAILSTTKVITDYEFLPRTFFFFMLPPIILDAGYFMPSRLFFSNLGTIVLFAVVGTIWNSFMIGFSLWGLSMTGLFGIDISLLELLLFGTLISAVDPVAVLAVFEEIHVNDILYIIVFGESLLNDAVTIVLYHMFEEYAVLGGDQITTTEILKGITSFPVVALGGTFIGILWGFLSGFATRFTHRVLVIEPIFVFLMAYLAHLSAELFHMSGVLAITFCGITMKNYVEANIAPNSVITVKYALKMLSSSSETIIFMYLGVSTVSSSHVWNWWFVIATVAFCTIYRFLGVLWLTAFVNPLRLNKVGYVDQFVMSYGGLRGAVSFALVLLIEEKAVGNADIRNMFVTTTIAVIFFTVFIQGITIKPLVELLKVKRAVHRELSLNERIQGRIMDHTLSGMESILGTVGQNKLRDTLKHWDRTYIKPFLIRDCNETERKILDAYEKIEMKEAIDMYRKHASASRLDSASSLNSPPARERVSISATDNGLTREVFERKPSTSVGLRRMSLAEVNDLFKEEDILIPARRFQQRRMSYSRHTLEPEEVGEGGASPRLPRPSRWETLSDQVKPIRSRPARKVGLSNLGIMNSSGEYMNPAFTITEENEDSSVTRNLSVKDDRSKTLNNTAKSLQQKDTSFSKVVQVDSPYDLHKIAANSNNRSRNDMYSRKVSTSSRGSSVSQDVSEPNSIPGQTLSGDVRGALTRASASGISDDTGIPGEYIITLPAITAATIPEEPAEPENGDVKK